MQTRERGSSRRPLKCKNKPKILSAKNLFHIQFSFLRQGILDRACPGLLAAACLIYSMLKKERNVTENKKKVRPAARSFKASLTHILVCGPAYITTLSLTNRGAVYAIRQTKKG